MLRKLYIIISLFLLSISLQAQVITVHTNALMDCLATPNLDFSLSTGSRSAISASVFGNYKPWGANMKMLGLAPAYKYWLGGRALDGYYLGFGATYLNYDIRGNGMRYNGETAGLGILFGYDIYLSKRLNLELHAGCGTYYYRQQRSPKSLDYERPSYKEKGVSILPMNVGISIGYIIN